MKVLDYSEQKIVFLYSFKTQKIYILESNMENNTMQAIQCLSKNRSMIFLIL